MDPIASPSRCRRWLALAVIAIVCPACEPAPGPKPAPRKLLPDRRIARRALEAALEEWRDSPQTDLAAATGRSLVFVDYQRQPGQKLSKFEILSESEVDNLRRFVVRLELTDPGETVLAPYYVFDRSPIWVYRAEDFDMMMNMDMAPESVPPATESSKETSTPEKQPGPGDAGATDVDGRGSES
ncbi:MAG: hypothetical protein ACYC61_25455 [Isosphaeraceae bacterium]